jgi:VanZ family protein
MVAYVALIFVVSSIPSLTAPGPEFLPKDKFAHVAEYFILGALLFKNIGWSVSRSRALTFGFLLAVGASVGALDEIYQSFIPGRMMSIYDWAADAMGTALGCGIYVFTRLGKHPPEAVIRARDLAGEGKRE